MSVRRAVPIITVDDVATALPAYRDVLGMVVLMDHGWIATLADPLDSGAQLSLMTRDATASMNPVTSVEVDDVDAAHAAAVSQGLEIVHPLSDEEWGVRRFFYRDASGNVINVLAHHRQTPSE